MKNTNNKNKYDKLKGAEFKPSIPLLVALAFADELIRFIKKEKGDEDISHNKMKYFQILCYFFSTAFLHSTK